MLSEITISRDFPIIAGYVQVPPNTENARNGITDKAALLSLASIPALAHAQLTSLSIGSGRPTGFQFGQQRFLRMPGVPQGPYTGPLYPDPAAVLGSPVPVSRSFPA